MESFASLSTQHVANHISFDRCLRGLQPCLHRFRQRPRLASVAQGRDDGAVEQFSPQSLVLDFRHSRLNGVVRGPCGSLPPDNFRLQVVGYVDQSP
ncbi:hypothetical protein Y032_0223g2664 [Ancylostoma ceylanicum]|uniref:Uncharacterized protein n=1 Tax=Ancylostoma ceylanicum TaxID=53326 RepID=A0A016SIG9_9BILA|nr:hypothetical protein Y032_0223g2664 [Ancylostoma ceylanicum]